MPNHIVERIYVKGLEREIDEWSDKSLYIHPSNFENWKLEFAAYDEEQLEFFKSLLRHKEQVEVAVYIKFMNRMTGKIRVKDIEDRWITAQGTSTLFGYRYIYKRGRFVTAF